MNNEISPLRKGDLIAIVAPAKAIDSNLVAEAKHFFEKNGYRVQIGKHCTGEFNYFSGTDVQRAADFQEALDLPEVKAIICARGGYGCIRILDRINWASMIRQPKWIVGFSDITVFHQRMEKYDLQSIHATMPLNFAENSTFALNTLLEALEGNQPTIEIGPNPSNKMGRVTGKLIGGNLSILYSLLGTEEQPDYAHKILFIEDLAEQLYHIDRMFYAFAKAGVFEKIKGLIIGGMTDLKDTATPTGFSIEQLITEHFAFRKIPIAFDFPAGHIADNRALIFGTEVELDVSDNGVILRKFVH